jgi:hypothetical protein
MKISGLFELEDIGRSGLKRDLTSALLSVKAIGRDAETGAMRAESRFPLARE